jgi:hypothetical protein
LKRIIAPLAGLAVLLAVAGTAAAAPAAHVAALPTLKLTLSGKSITVSGSPVAGAVNVTSVTKTAQGSPTLVHLDPGVSFAKAFGAVASHHGDPNYLSGLAQIDYNGATTKGTHTDQTVLTPGHWVAMDTTSNNPAKWPHVAFTVAPSKHPRALPHADATVNMIDFAFTGPSTWHDGEVIRFADAGFETHMVVAARAADATSAAALSAALVAGNDNAAQTMATGFATFVGLASPGAVQQEKITAAPGTYVLACFMDTQDGREHTRLGMVKTITITG